MELSDWIGRVLLDVVIVGGLLTFLGKNWIKHQLAKNLESAKSEMSLKLESAKSEISFHAANRLKFRDKEYEVFPEIWARLSDAKASLEVAIEEAASEERPDFGRMDNKDVKEWLASTDFTKDEKEAMIASRDRMSCFDRILECRDLRRARESFWEFETYLQKNRIFLSEEIEDKFDDIKNLLVEAWAAKKTGVQYRGQAGYVSFLKKTLAIFNDKVEPLMKKLEDIIQGKLSPKGEATKQ